MTPRVCAIVLPLMLTGCTPHVAQPLAPEHLPDPHAAFWDSPRVGTNVFDDVSPDDLVAARERGLDFVRIAPTSWPTASRDFLIGDADHYGGIPASDLAELRRVLDHADRIGIKIVLTTLSIPGMRWHQHNDDETDNRVWESNEFMEQTADFWNDLIRALRGHPALVGYNVINEPRTRETNAFNLRLVRAIREADPLAFIILDSGDDAAPTAFAHLDPVADPRVLYSFHLYEPWEHTTFRRNRGEVGYPSHRWNRTALLQGTDVVRAWQSQHDIPSSRILMGEFGCDRRVPGAPRYLHDAIEIANRSDWHWAFYSFRETEWNAMDYELGTEAPLISPTPRRENTLIDAIDAGIEEAHRDQPLERLFDVEHYAVTMDIDVDGNIQGTAGIDIVPTRYVALSTAHLTIEATRTDPPSVRCVDSSEVGMIVLYCDASIDHIAIEYGAAPGRGLVANDIVRSGFHTMDWMPVNFDPSDRATLSLEARVPNGYGLYAVGQEVAPHARDFSHRYELREPFPSYTFAFAAGPFELAHRSVDGIEQRIVHRGFSAEQVHALIEKAASAMRVFREIAGVPYPHASFTQIWLSDDAAQEAAGLALMRESEATVFFADPSEDWLLVHEIAHQWWGNSVTAASWSEFWLNEGFATFMTAAYKERSREGDTGRAAYDREVALARERLSRLVASGRDRALRFPGLISPDDAGGPLPYSKGLLFLDELRREVGEETFWQALRSYTRQNWAASARTADLERAFADVGASSVRELFREWTEIQ